MDQVMGQQARQQHRAFLVLSTRLYDDSDLALVRDVGRRLLDAVTSVNEIIRGNLLHIPRIAVDQRDAPLAEEMGAFELNAPRPRLGRAGENAVANTRHPRPLGEELRMLHAQDALRIELELRVAFLVERMRRDRVGRAAAADIWGDEIPAGVIVELWDAAIPGRTRVAGQRAAFQDMPDVIGKTGIDAAANHVARKQRDVAGTAGQDELRAGFERSDERMDAHLPHDRALAQPLLRHARADTG